MEEADCVGCGVPEPAAKEEEDEEEGVESDENEDGRRSGPLCCGSSLFLFSVLSS